LAETFINKLVVETFFHNLFWYVDENAQPGDGNSKAIWQSTTPMGERLNTLYGRFQKGMFFPWFPRAISSLNLCRTDGDDWLAYSRKRVLACLAHHYIPPLQLGCHGADQGPHVWRGDQSPPRRQMHSPRFEVAGEQNAFVSLEED
jgi:hypothetical protein